MINQELQMKNLNNKSCKYCSPRVGLQAGYVMGLSDKRCNELNKTDHTSQEHFNYVKEYEKK